MVNELIGARLGTAHPEHNPALQGATPPLTDRERALLDEQGRPLLPRIVRALRAGLTMPPPAVVLAERPRSVLDAGLPYPAIDPALLAQYEQRGHQLQAVVAGEILGQGLRALGRGLAALAHRIARGVNWLLQPAPADHELQRRELGRPGALDVPPDYEQRRSNFYGRGL
jgi:hypothetical protein